MRLTHHLSFLVLFSFLCGAATVNAQYIVAHRGASHDAPENTIAAFELAWEQEADAIEGDFYVTRDQQIVCIHDATTKRTAPGQTVRSVADSTLAELRQLEYGSWKDKRFAGEPIPTLQEVLATVPAGKKIFIEIKTGPHILPLMKPLVEGSGLKPEQIIIICFNEEVIAQARKMMPQFKASWLTSYKQNAQTGAWTPTPETILETLKRSSATGLGSNGNQHAFNRSVVQKVKDAGWEAHVWTVNDDDDARHFSDIGVDSITTDRPAAIRAALQAGATAAAAE